MAQEVKSLDFNDKVLKANKPVLVDFFATWCGPCKMVAPIIDQIATEYADQIDVYKLDIDASPDIAATYGVNSVPTLITFVDGEPQKRTVGAQPKEQIVAEMIP